MEPIILAKFTAGYVLGYCLMNTTKRRYTYMGMLAYFAALYLTVNYT